MCLSQRGGQGKQENKRKNSQTHKAVRVLGSRAAPGTLSMTTVTDIGPVAPAVTLFCTHRPCHCRRQIWSLDQSRPPRETSKVTWRSWEKLGSRMMIDPPLTQFNKCLPNEVCNRLKLLYKNLPNKHTN